MTPPPAFRELPGVSDPIRVLERLRHLPLSLALLSQGPVGPRSRFSYVMADPVESVIWRHGDAVGDPLVKLAGARSSEPARIGELPPFRGGWAGLVGYGYGRTLEELPTPAFDEFKPPDIIMGNYRCLAAFDRLSGKCWLVASHETPGDSAEALDRFAACIEGAPARRPPAFPIKGTDPSILEKVPGKDGILSHFSRERYEKAVARAIEYVRAGDCFQVNLAQRLCRRDAGDPLELLKSMAKVNPAPFAAWLDWGEGQLVSASPERFLRVENGMVETRPIKGTRPRSEDPTADAAVARELLSNPKDRAENIMIVDLLRNDIGKACAYGSVKVPRLCELESYPTVHHMVSQVTGRLADGRNAINLLRGCFPGGSVTGAPKVRSMEIINELEETARGPYCGTMFWAGDDGGFDSSILIRTVTRSGGWLTFPVGGGIVADSSPSNEYDETMHKAAGILRGIGHCLSRTGGIDDGR